MAAPVPKRKRSRFAVICVALSLVTGSLTLAKPGNRYSPFQFVLGAKESSSNWPTPSSKQHMCATHPKSARLPYRLLFAWDNGQPQVSLLLEGTVSFPFFV